MPSPAPEIRVRSYQPGDSEAFRTLNEQWILKYFTLEEPDRLVLNHPEEHILRPGGAVVMAFAGEIPVGTCALIAEGDGVFELAKMAVDETRQGQGIGRKLLEYTLAEARKMGARRVVLGSNSQLAPAIHLYESVGFKHVQPEHPSPYARANVFMELNF
jgi:GNAT superfamily N-acetyltransferase